MDKTIKWLYDLQAQELTRLSLAQEYEAILVKNLEEVKDILLSRISVEESLVIGDSPVLDELNLLSTFKEKGNFIYNHQDETDLEKRIDIRRNSLLADNYISEVDFITENGELIFLGGFSNAAALFGPNKVYGILGINKLVKNITEAEKKVEKIIEAHSYRERSSYDKDMYDNIGIVSNGKKFINKYTIFIVPDHIGF